MIDDIAHLLADDAVIVLGGCTVAQDDEYVPELADAVGVTIIASDANVDYYHEEHSGDDFFSRGDWEVFVPDGEEATVSPDDLGLTEVDGTPSNTKEEKEHKTVKNGELVSMP